MKSLTPLEIDRVLFGSDPEFFLQDKKGEIIGSQRLIPLEGLGSAQMYDYSIGQYTNRVPLLVRDGVQVEGHPIPAHCRTVFLGKIHSVIHLLDQQAKDKGYTVSYKALIKISKKELDALEPEAKQLGCKPSLSAYGENRPITINPEVYRYRSAGGHIHVGKINEKLKDVIKPEIANRIIKVMDILIGNTCVIIDQDKGQIERRKNYGRAGEYRMTKYGFEYRTLSNFWLISPRVASFVLGMTRVACNVVIKSTKEKNYEEELLKLVTEKDIVKAINTNNKKLALKNYKKIKPWIIQVLPTDNQQEHIPMSGKYIEQLDYFLSQPLSKWFYTTDYLRNWKEGNAGFESFLMQEVSEAMNKAKLAKTDKKKDKQTTLKEKVEEKLAVKPNLTTTEMIRTIYGLDVAVPARDNTVLTTEGLVRFEELGFEDKVVAPKKRVSNIRAILNKKVAKK